MPEARSYLRADGSCPFDGIKDARAQAKIDTAVRKLERGLRTDVAPMGEGAHESRLHYGPGYRIYFGNVGAELVVLLLCGDKRAQDEDIAFAKALWSEYRARKAARPSKPGQPGPKPLLKPKEDDGGADA
jgi:putative addiction module killer protein